MSNRDRHGQHPYGSVHKAARKGWDRLVKAGGVICWRCGESMPRHARWDLGHVDEEGRRAGYPLRHPEHTWCNRATVTHLKQKLETPGRAEARTSRDW